MQNQEQQQSLPRETIERMRATSPLLHNGIYSISHEKRGHFTVKVGTAQKGELAGRRIIYLLTGPDNTRDWRGVAFYEETPDKDGRPWPRASIWKKYRGPDSRLPLDGYHYQAAKGWSEYEQRIAIFLDLALRELAKEKVYPNASHFAAEGYRIQRSSRCLRCNRLLTHPESIDLGIGPECASR